MGVVDPAAKASALQESKFRTAGTPGGRAGLAPRSGILTYMAAVDPVSFVRQTAPFDALPEPLGDPGSEVAGEGRVREQRLELTLRQPVGEQVLLDGDVERRLSGDERGEAEDLALLEELERLPLALDPDGALADHVQELGRLAALGQQPGP